MLFINRRSMAVFLLTSGLAFSNILQAEMSIRIANDEYPPFMSAKLKFFGVGYRIIKEAFALEGVKVESRFFPPGRSLEMVKSGTWDASSLWSPNAERKKTMVFSDAIVHIDMVLFHKRSFEFNWTNIGNLTGLRIGATIGYFYGDLFHAAEKAGTLKVERVTSNELNFRKLHRGRIDVFPLNVDSAFEILNRIYNSEERKQFVYSQKPITSQPLSLAFSKVVGKNNKLRILFNRGLKTLKESGKLDMYLKESRDGKYKNNK